MRRRHASTLQATLAVALAMAIVLGVIVVGLWALFGRPRPNSETPVIPVDHCTAVAGGYSGSLSPEQAGNAAIIVGESIRRGLPARAATIAIVAALQESRLYNIDYGDLDSLGLFQQRPSQGWGTPEQIMDPWYAAGKFYDALVKLPHWQSDPIGSVAQQVQRSAYPDAYAAHESAGRAIASALTGQTPASFRCIANDGDGGGGDGLVALLAQVWGGNITIIQAATTVTVETADATTAWAVAQLSMAQLAASGLASVQVGDQLWTHRATAIASWGDVPAAPPVTPTPDQTPAAPDDTVLITLR